MPSALQGATGLAAQELTLLLLALAKNVEVVEDLCWLFPNIAPLAAILNLGGQKEFYQL